MTRRTIPSNKELYQPRLVLAAFLAFHGLLFRAVGSDAPRISMGGFLPGSFVSWALSLSSLVFLIAAVATVVEAKTTRLGGDNWRSLGSLVFALMGMSDLVAGLLLSQSAPDTSWLFRVLGMPIALSGVAMGAVGFGSSRQGSERLVAVAGVVLNGFVFLLGIVAPAVVRLAR